ncbi:hypothetical protein [Hamadaea tsunoensis]|uniref:hypothetical protein n=1 Tax=Hamadaea tsunoensis TaxID=53368 RepID=UPI0004072BFA|nr:hypothetical protein [Hamadaea tsunoensis]
MHQLRLVLTVLQAMRSTYAEVVRDFVATRMRTRLGRLTFALLVLAVGLSTGGQLLVTAYAESSPLIRLTAFVAACTWVFGFGHTAALVARPAAKSR